MPIYEYRCLGCGEINEFLVTSQTADEDLVCKHCGSTDLIKVLSAGSYTMKGGGNGRRSSRCGKEQPCCGAKTRCETPPCKS